ncbi:hypothetical protein [Brevundimonas sp.]|uniref:hypothetical protein n=1 Tax=Brevundimonas sp. TaxID=1871086 RepID=UPI00286C0C2B|nr:hypothetical protein [Brevundimonas sp.]
MLWTGLIMAALLVAQDTTTTPSQDAPATDVAPVTVQGPRLETGANTRASDPQQEVICRTAPVTGSRFNQRRCRTRLQAQIAATEAQSALTAMTGSGGSVEEIANAGGAPAGPR